MFVNQTQALKNVPVVQKSHDFQPNFIWYIDIGITLVLIIIFVLFDQQQFRQLLISFDFFHQSTLLLFVLTNKHIFYKLINDFESQFKITRFQKIRRYFWTHFLSRIVFSCKQLKKKLRTEASNWFSQYDFKGIWFPQ